MTLHGMGILRPESVALPYRLWDCGVTWKDINPAKGVWEWDLLDTYLTLTRRPLLVLGATPQWAAKYPTAPHAAPWLGPGTNSPPADLRAWDEYVRQVVTRYKGRILAYQVWNEPQLKHFWYPDGYITLGTMTKRAQAIINEIDPEALVVAAPVLPRPSSGGTRRGSRYLTQLRAKGWPVDVFSLHCYPEEGYGAARVSWMIKEMRQALADLKAPNKPLWITEINYNLLHGELPLDQQLELLRATEIVMTRSRISRGYWYAYEHSDPRVLGVTFSKGSQTVRTLMRLNA